MESIIFWAFIALSIHLYIRNLRVSAFRRAVVGICIVYAEVKNDDSVFTWCYDCMPSYSAMVGSLRPLTLGHWLPQEVVEELASVLLPIAEKKQNTV